MFIQTEHTPNPATLKFMPGKTVLGDGTVDYRSRSEPRCSPLATRLFDVDGVTGVFLGSDFISVTKGDVEWPHIKPAILGAIMEHYMSGAPAVAWRRGGRAGCAGEEYDPKDEDTVKTIKELLDTRVRPAVANDGGDITFHGFKDGVGVPAHARGLLGLPQLHGHAARHGIETCSSTSVPTCRRCGQSPASGSARCMRDGPRWMRRGAVHALWEDAANCRHGCDDAALRRLSSRRTRTGVASRARCRTGVLREVVDLMKIGPHRQQQCFPPASCSVEDQSGQGAAEAASERRQRRQDHGSARPPRSSATTCVLFRHPAQGPGSAERPRRQPRPGLHGGLPQRLALQAALLMMAARSLGLDCGPMRASTAPTSTGIFRRQPE